MGNTLFYEEVKKENPSIHWKDILSESFKKHTMKDLEYALAAGSAYDTASKETMLKKWHKPWVWTRVLAILSITGFALFMIYSLFGHNPNVGWPMLIILTCITPVSSMILIWELNVARDVSIFKLLGCFLVGGVLSFFFTLLLGSVGVDEIAWAITNTDAKGLWGLWVAPLTEEPGKLLAGLVILMMIAKSGKPIFGCTGLAVAAGVGTGFTLFESFGYVMSNAVTEGSTWSELFSYGLSVIFVRSFPGINGHMLMCVPYIAMLALVYHETNDWKKSLLDRRTVITFLVACVLHGLWDCMGGVLQLLANLHLLSVSFINEHILAFYMIQEILYTVGYLLNCLYAIRLCLRQAVREGHYVSGQGMALGERTHYKSAPSNATVAATTPAATMAATVPAATAPAAAAAMMAVSTGTILRGAAWQCSNTTLVGKLNDCQIKFPSDTAGLSRVHCRLSNNGSSWTVSDMGSSYGTFLNGSRLEAHREYPLTSGSVLTLGSKSVELTVQF